MKKDAPTEKGGGKSLFHYVPTSLRARGGGKEGEDFSSVGIGASPFRGRGRGRGKKKRDPRAPALALGEKRGSEGKDGRFSLSRRKARKKRDD